MKRMFALLLILAAGAVLAADRFLARHVFLDGRWFDRDTTVLQLPGGVEDVNLLTEFPHLRWLDLRGIGITGEEYRRLQQTLPDCRIVWELSFQGKSVSAAAKELSVDHLTDADVLALDDLPKLRKIDAACCQDYPQLLELARRKPECFVDYNVALGSQDWNCRDTAIAPGSCTASEAAAALPLLPRVQRVDLRATGITHEEAVMLADAFPKIRFLWNAEFGGVTFPTDSQVIDLSGIAMEDTSQVEALIPYLPELKKVIMCDCGIPSQQMADLNDRYPDIRFVWRVKLGPLSARTDDTWFAPITHRQLIGGHDADELKYCTDMECIDLGHCWISDCEWARGMKSLKYLVLADTYVRDLSPLSELKNLQYLELFVTPVKDYTPLLGCTGLEDLNLGYTYGDPTPISRMPWLKNLWWGGIHYVSPVNGQNPADLLRRSLPDTHLVFYAGSSTGLGWRNLKHYYEMRDIIGMYYMTG